MELNLKKPLVFIDLETTGLDIATARIVEIGIVKINSNGVKEIYETLVNPQISIPSETSEVHGITDEDVKDKPSFNEISEYVIKFIGNADLAGYNILRFDLPLIVEEFLRCDIVFDISDRHVIDVQSIFHKMEPRTLSGAYRFYCNKEINNAHTAIADAEATYEILKAQIDRYRDIPFKEKSVITYPIVNDVELLGKFSIQKRFVDIAGNIVLNDNNIPVFNFGKYKGKSVAEVFEKEPQYLDWIMKSNFPEYTKRIFQKQYLMMLNNGKFKIE